MFERISIENLLSNFEVLVLDLLQNQFDLHLVSVRERLDLKGTHVEGRHFEEILLAFVHNVHVPCRFPIEFLVKNHILDLNIAPE
jgi:hypothetical protein